MGKGTTTVTPKLPEELSGLYTQTANNIMRGQNILPLFGGAGRSGTITPNPNPPGVPGEDPNEVKPGQPPPFRRVLPTG